MSAHAKITAKIDNAFTRVARIFLLGFIAALELQCTAPPACDRADFFAGAVGKRMRNDCAIVATEAAARLQRTGCWTRILTINYVDRSDPRQIQRCHAMTVWQPRAAAKIYIYDQALIDATAELNTESHDATTIGQIFAARWNLTFIGARFVQ